MRKAQEVFPPGVVNLVCGDRDTGARLAAHPVPRMISITGSTRAGIAVATAAAPDLKVAHLELGGKAPVIVFDDADLEAAVEGIRTGGFFNAGQDCTAATRVICQDGIYDRFVAALAEAAAGTRTGFDPTDEDLFYGPINNARQLAHVSGLVDRVAEHAQVVTGGTAVGDRGFFYAPTVIADVRQGDEAVVTEIFGPVITVQRFRDEDEAVRHGQRHRVRARVLGLDDRRGPGGPGAGAARLRLRLGEHPHPAGGGDAARRVQALGLRQGPVDVQPRGLHAGQARHAAPRLRGMSRTGTVPLRVTLCRGCCCGTVKKRPDVDHEAQRIRLHALAAAGTIACRETDCLGPCDSANVMVVNPTPHGRRSGRPTDVVR